jgi:hypothetical protein
VEVIDPDGYVLVFTEPLDTTKEFDQVLAQIQERPDRSGG